jgi:lipopolysaccharide export LptBFGC system permease protein LptF
LSLLSRYLLRESLLPAGVGVIFLLFILIANRFLKLLPILVSARIPLGEIMTTLGYLIPGFLIYALPPALFLGWVVGLSRLGSEGELVGAMGLGLSPVKFLRSPLVVSLSAGILVLVFSEWGYAQGRTRFTQRVKELVARYTLSALNPGTLIELPRSTVVALTRPREGNPPTFFLASPEFGVMAGELSAPSSITTTLTIEKGFLYTSNTTEPVLLEFARGTITLEIPMEEIRDSEAETLSILYKKRHDPQRGYEFYRFLSFSFSFFYAPLAAFLIASRRLRSGRGNALLRTVLVLLLFYTFINLGHRLLQKGILSPFAGAFLPHILLLPLALLFFRKLTRPGHP